jgi:hypothetical protein
MSEPSGGSAKSPRNGFGVDRLRAYGAWRKRLAPSSLWEPGDVCNELFRRGSAPYRTREMTGTNNGPWILPSTSGWSMPRKWPDRNGRSPLPYKRGQEARTVTSAKYILQPMEQSRPAAIGGEVRRLQISRLRRGATLAPDASLWSRFPLRH